MGILVSHFFPIQFLTFPLLCFLFLLVCLLWLWSRKQLIQSTYFGIAVYSSFFSLGYFSYQMRLPQFQAAHYSHIAFDDTVQVIQLKIGQPLKPDTFNTKYFAQVNAINGIPTKGKILLNVSKDSIQKHLAADAVILVYASIAEIPKPLNPHQFDYSEYMKSLGVYGQIRVSEKQIIHTYNGTTTLTGFAQNKREFIIEKLKKTKLKTDERAIIQALILGEKTEINKDLYNDYAAAGAVHILAVSGLHVGIIYVILTFLLTPMRRWKYGKTLHSLLIVILLWNFAILSGLSPSVTRAVTMFSFFALAKLLNRETNSINTLFLSFLTLLIINPLWLFHVGFQLSYLAVFFIVWLLPVFLKLGYSKYWLVRNLWAIVAVSICAQIGVLPLSLYYFHQFPGLFLLTNIVILPFLTLLMCGGILIVVLATIAILPDWLAESYNYLIEGLNAFIHWVAVQDQFLFRDIHFSSLKVLGAYLFIFSLALYIKKLNYSRLVISLLSIALFISIYIYDEYKTSTNRFVVFQKSKQTLIGYLNRKHLTIFTNDSTEDIHQKHPIKSFKIEINAKTLAKEKLPSFFIYNNKRNLILDSLGIIPRQKNIHTIILTNSPKVNLNRVIDSLSPKQIIADGSNYFSNVKLWEKTCKLKKLPFYHTAKQGAFSLK